MLGGFTDKPWTYKEGFQYSTTNRSFVFCITRRGVLSKYVNELMKWISL